jgi:putative tricarboxylic transport membrane protein
MAVALGVATLAGLSAWQTSIIPQSVYAAIGPRVFPWMVAGLLGVVAIGLVVAALRGGWARENDGEITEWRSLAWFVGGLLANLLLIEGVSLSRLSLSGPGFVVASTVMFVCIARGFGSDRPLRDAAIGLAVATLGFIGFDKFLGYRIGAGFGDEWLSRAADRLWVWLSGIVWR